MNSIRKISISYAYTFALFFVIFVPIPYYLFPLQEKGIDILLNKPLSSLSKVFFQEDYSLNQISSDSTLMYLLVLMLAVVSLPVSFLILKIRDTKKSKLYLFTRTVLFYFLSLQLLKYGFDKIFKMQFYLPEPNILFTKFGSLDKDILYWSTIGTSYSYNVCTGIIEAAAAFLLLFKRTRVAGLFITIGILIHICLINFSFDISVKLFSLFLLFISILLISPHLKKIFVFFFYNTSAPISSTYINEELFPNTALHRGLKCFVIGLLIIEAFYPAITRGNYNDDRAPRPFLHGAYEVTEFRKNNEEVPLSESPAKRIFFHRDEFIIFQDQNDVMHDQKLEIDTISKVLTTTDYMKHQSKFTFSYSSKDSILIIHGTLDSAYFQFITKAINWKQMPALRNSFHFRSDSGGID